MRCWLSAMDFSLNLRLENMFQRSSALGDQLLGNIIWFLIFSIF